MTHQEERLLFLLAFLCPLHVFPERVSMDTEYTVPAQYASTIEENEDVQDLASATDTHNGATKQDTMDDVTIGAFDHEPSFQILTLRTEVGQDSYSFQLVYTSHNGITIRVAEKASSGFIDILKENDFQNSFEDGQGVVSATSGTPRFEVLFESCDRRWQSKVFVNVKNTTQLRVQPLLLRTNIENEVVFNKGETVEIQVQTAKRIESGHPFDNGGIVYGMYSFSRNDSNTVFDAGTNFPGIIQKGSSKEFVDYDEHTLIINRDGEDYEGAAYVGMYMHTRGPLEAYGNEQIITVRMMNHRTPYSEGSLGFLRVGHIPWNSYCREGLTCATFASIVGNDPEDITLWKHHDDGRNQMMDVPFHKYRYEYVVVKRFYLSNISRSDAGTYTYRGTDSTGSVVEKDFELNVLVR